VGLVFFILPNDSAMRSILLADNLIAGFNYLQKPCQLKKINSTIKRITGKDYQTKITLSLI